MRLLYFLSASALVLGRADAARAFECVVGHAHDYQNQNQNQNQNRNQNQNQNENPNENMNQNQDVNVNKNHGWNGNTDDASVSALAEGHPAEDYSSQNNNNNNNNNGGWSGNSNDASMSALAGGQQASSSLSMATHTMLAHDVTVAGVMSSTAVPTTLRTMTTPAAQAVSAAGVASAAEAVSAAGVVSAAEAVSAEAMTEAATTSNFVLTATAVPKADRRPAPNSSSVLAMAIVVPLLALIAFVAAIVFRMYRTKKEREEAFAAEAVRAKTRAIEKQMEDLDAISEKYDMGKNRGIVDAKELSADIPIELEADDSDKRRFHGL